MWSMCIYIYISDVKIQMLKYATVLAIDSSDDLINGYAYWMSN